MALILTGACGDDEPTTATTTTVDSSSRDRTVDDAVVDRVSKAAANTVDEGTAEFTVVVETRGVDTGEAGTTTTDRDTTTTTDRRTTTTDAPAEGEALGDQRFEAEGEVDFEVEQRRLTLQGPEGELDVVIDTTDVYVELPATEGDDWMRIELDRLFDEEVGFGGPAALPFQDPAGNLRVLQGSAVHAQEVGDEQVGSDDTTHYELIIDLQAAGRQSSPEVEDAIEQTVRRTGMDELEMDVWVDQDDRVRRVSYTLSLNEAEVREEEGSVEADPRGDVVVTTEYDSFGTTVDIDIPSDDDVVDLDEDALRESFGGSSAGSDREGTTTSTTGRDGTTSTTRPTTTTTS